MIRTGRAVLVFVVSFSAALVPLRTASAEPRIGHPAGFTTGTQRAYVPGQVIVRYRSGSGRVQRARVGAVGAVRLAVARTELLALPTGETVAGALASLRADPAVEFAEPNYIRRLTATVPNDTFFDREWGLQNTGQIVPPSTGTAGTAGDDIGATTAWDTTTGSDAIVIGVLDSGVAYDHPDLAPNIWANAGETGGGKETNGLDDDANGYIDDVRGWDFISNDNNPRDHHGHGTHVSGTIGARGNDGYGVAGVNWSAKLMPVRVANGDGEVTSANLMNAFTYAAANGARVVNGSFGGGSPSSAEITAIRNATNTLFVFAAGNNANNNDTSPTYPCSYGARYDMTNVICVAATNNNDALASFSNFGLGSVGLAAPGVDIASTWPATATPVWSEDFENDISATWTRGGTGSAWARTTTEAESGANSLTDTPAGPYADDSNTWIQTTTPINLAGQEGCTFDGFFKLDLEEGFDFVFVETSPDGVTWDAPILTGTGLPSDPSGWDEVSASVEAYDGRPMYLRFRVSTDEFGISDGVYVDNVTVTCLSGAYDGTQFQYSSGTSMASPHVAGAAGLLFAQDATRTPAAVRALLLGSVDRRTSLASKTLAGGRLNVATALGATADLTAPVVTTNAFARPVQLGTALPVSWSATDAGTGVSVYAANLRAISYKGITGTSFLWRNWSTSHAATLGGRSGYTYCFRGRARDRADNRGQSSYERCSAVPLGDRSLSARSFARRSGSGTLFGTYSEATIRGASLSLGSVRYRYLAIIVTRCPGCGSIDVYFGSTKLKSISLSSSTTVRKVLYGISSRTSLSGAGTVSIRVTSSGKPVRIEGLGVLAF